MTAINFPDNPQINDTFTVEDRTWKWTGAFWDIVATIQVVGPPGPKGLDGGSFEFTPSDARQVWVITHNLGYNPNVTVSDSVGTEYFGQITYTNSNSLTITFNQAVYGTAYLS